MLTRLKNPLSILAITLCFFILRMAIPFALFGFIIGLIISYVFSYKEIYYSLIKYKKTDFYIFIPFLATIVCFATAILFDKSHETIIYKELFNIPLIIALLILFITIVNKSNLNEFIEYFYKYYLYLIGCVSIIALIKFWFQLKGIYIPLLINHEKYPWGFSLSTDYNFYSVAIFIAFLFLLWGDKFNKLKNKKIEYVLYILVCINIFYSGSRRGILILFSILIIQLLLSFYFYIKNKKKDSVLLKTIVGIIVILSQVYFLYFASFKERKITAKIIGVYALPYKKEITAISFRYITLIKPKADYKKMYVEMWPKEDIGTNEKEEVIKEPLFEKTTYGSRIERWKYAFYLFINKYTLTEKFFGKGFSYLKNFAYRFNVILFNSYDYPHNPIIASLLYAGIIGLVSILFYLTYSLYLIYQLKLYSSILLTSYFLISFFSLLSGNSYFSIPIYVAITLLPYYIKFLNSNKVLKTKKVN